MRVRRELEKNVWKMLRSLRDGRSDLGQENFLKEGAIVAISNAAEGRGMMRT